MATDAVITPTAIGRSAYQTALGILLPPSSPYYKSIVTLRSLYDKNHKTWPWPHVNILYPFVAPEKLPDAVDTIQRFLASWNQNAIESGKTLKFRLNAAGLWKQKDHATVYLTTSENGAEGDGNFNLRALRRELLGLFPQDRGTEGSSYTPHLTIGQTALDDEVMMGLLAKTEKLLENAKNEEGDGIVCEVGRLVVLQRTGRVGSAMRIVGEIILGASSRMSGDGDGGQDIPEFPTKGVMESTSTMPDLCQVYAFSQSTGAYQPYVPTQETAPQVIHNLTIATYNILTESAVPTAPGTSRYPLLLSSILSTPALVLNLQEVTDDFLSYLLSRPEIQQKYPYSTHSPSHGVLPSWRNCVTLASIPFGGLSGKWEWVDLGKRHKGAVVVEIEFFADKAKTQSEIGIRRKLVIANVHLTCGISDRSIAAKATQLRILTTYFTGRKTPQHADEVWIIGGDLNIPTSHSTIKTAYMSKLISQETYNLLGKAIGDDKGRALVPSIWQDAYEQTHSSNEIAEIEDLKFDIGRDGAPNDSEGASWSEPGSGIDDWTLGPGEFGATFNPFRNKLAAESVKWGANPRPQRYDRILISRTVGNDLVEIKRTGRFGMEGGSDHWGLYADFKFHHNQQHESQGKTVDVKGWHRVEPRLQSDSAIADEQLEGYLSENGMLPSPKDYALREEAKQVLTNVLTGGGLKANKRSHTSADADLITQVPYVNVLADDTTTAALAHQVQNLGVTEKPHLKLIVQPVGSYYMNLFTPTSDLDILCASNISARVFWVLAKQRIRNHNRMLLKERKREGSIRIVRSVEAQSGVMMELEYIGGVVSRSEEIGLEGADGRYAESEEPTEEATSQYHRVRMDLQYCQVPEKVLDSWSQLPHLRSSDPIFSLAATTLKKLNAYRDASYLLNTIPNLKLFRLTYRALKLWAVRRGIFSARFGYLGGIHLVLLLSRVFKRISPDQVMDLTAGEVLKLFFEDYAGFQYEEDTVSDPDFAAEGSAYRRAATREPFAISTIHNPMVNVAHTASKHTLKTLRDEILLANQKLGRNCGWDAVTGSADGEAEREFLNGFGNFVKIDLHYWGRNTARGRTLVGWIESRSVMLLVELNAKVPNMHARMWPGRFVNINESQSNEELHGFYLIGLLSTKPASPRSSPPQHSEEAKELNEQKKQAYNKFIDILRSFEAYLREEEKKYEVTESYIGVGQVSRQALGDGVRIDNHIWWDEDYEVGDEGSYNHYSNEGEDDEDSLDDMDEDYTSLYEEEECQRKERASGDKYHDTDLAGTGDNQNSSAQASLGRPSSAKRQRQRRQQLQQEPEAVAPPSQERIKKAKLRPVQDIINRIKWDPAMDIHDYIVGYEDRFLGTMVMNLAKWTSKRRDETDEEWIPLHRVVWVKRARDGKVIWDKEERIDMLFGSGTVGEGAAAQVNNA
ncbi:hypothetical protein BDZ91DRAFT_796992 [Kalaharituber pfeilii]|nr:hypothetical protein BDZ91DRAFT_796992 [Kalaharituber pfeilii]